MISYQFLLDVQLRPDKTPDFSAYPFCLPLCATSAGSNSIRP